MPLFKHTTPGLLPLQQVQQMQQQNHQQQLQQQQQQQQQVQHQQQEKKAAAMARRPGATKEDLARTPPKRTQNHDLARRDASGTGNAAAGDPAAATLATWDELGTPSHLLGSDVPINLLGDLSPSTAAVHVEEATRGLLTHGYEELMWGEDIGKLPKVPRTEATEVQPEQVWQTSPKHRKFPNVRPIRKFVAADDKPWSQEVQRPLAVPTQPGAEDEELCSVCGSGESAEDDAILICDGCNAYAHQSCYSIQKVPEGDWFCARCQALRATNTLGMDQLSDTHVCALCPSYGGAMWPVCGRLPAGVMQSRWVHAACAVWTPEARVVFSEDKEKDENGNPIVHVDLSKLTASRTNLKCQECQQKGGGVVQCLSKKCMMGYHKTCAQRAKCIAEYAETSKGDVMACMFCPKHSTPDLAAWRLTCTRSGGNI